jgi:L-threonylcarbamoyladenylate synthase
MRLGDWAADVPGYAISLARDFWPGPMTLIMKRSELAADFVTGGQDTVGVRVPDHPVALGLLEAFARAGGRVWRRQVLIALEMFHRQLRKLLADELE